MFNNTIMVNGKPFDLFKGYQDKCKEKSELYEKVWKVYSKTNRKLGSLKDTKENAKLIKNLKEINKMLEDIYFNRQEVE